MMYTLTHLHQTLFLDIETVSGYSDYTDMPTAWREQWNKKHKNLKRFLDDDASPSDSYSDRAAIYSEFGKIVCISMGILVNMEGQEVLRLKSIANDDEKELLLEFSDILNKHYNDPARHFLCGHNVREFDIPYIGRRLLVNGLDVPPILEVRGKKPWEIKHFIDTLELWKFGDYKSFASLDLLTHLFGISSPKEAMDGSEVGKYYWGKGDLRSICRYCEQDVLAVVQVLRKMCGYSLLESTQVKFTQSEEEE